MIGDLFHTVIAWPTLAMALLIFGFAPGVLLRLIVLGFRRDDPRRRELLAELHAVPRIERPFWVIEQFEVALFEGVLKRFTRAAPSGSAFGYRAAIRVPPRLRVYLTTTVSLVAVALATLLGMEAGSAPSARQWWTLGAVLAGLAAAGVPAYEQIRKERLRAFAEHAAIDAAVAMRITMNDALDPIARHLGRIATASRRYDREVLQEAIIPMILDSVAHLIAARQVRATWFRLIEGRPSALVPYQYAGRADEPQTVFVEGTVEGDNAFAMIRHKQLLVVQDIDTDPPPGWPVTRHTYKSLIAVPVVAGHKPLGMLTVDTVDIAGVSEAEVPLVRLLANLLADALAYGPTSLDSNQVG